ncbi:tyrosine-type recombinase/integrase [Chryseobacterium daeguense]|uniref:tyrosine-type recombinase/integrase n=1 Tax=Chryseobacterium daeguense TaxID=412438 RepID=UPI000406F334|nr:site-specific integrase [Chryseobacterium daeguense]
MKSYSNMKVYPINWETSKKSVLKNWIVRYIFTDANGIEQEATFKGMNHIKDHALRVQETKRLIEEEIYMLELGYNPKTKKYEDNSGLDIVNPATLFLAACNICIAEKECVDTTRTDMENSMKHITKYATKLGLHKKKIKDITKSDIKQILKYMKKDNHSNYRINKTKSHLSACFTYFTDDLDIFQVNFVRGISKLPHESAKKEIIRTDEDWNKFHSIEHINLNVYMFMYIFLYSGCRFEEMVKVKKEDVELEKSVFWIHLLKGGKHTRAMRAINLNAFKYWKIIYDRAKPGQYLFSHNQLPNDEPVKANSLYDLCTKYFKKVGLNITGYALKYTYLNLVAKIYGISIAKEAAGHTSERTTKIYAVDYEIEQVEKNKNIDICI